MPFLLRLSSPKTHSNKQESVLLAFANLKAEIAKISFGPLRNIHLQSTPVFLPVFGLNLLEIAGLPVEAHKAADKELRTIFGGLHYGLVKE